MNRNSYTSADALPAKLITDSDLISDIQEFHAIPPIHPQVIPTNRCNLSCEFCSCANEDRSLHMKREDMYLLAEVLADMGAEAVTITGGGEPLMHSDLNEFIEELGHWDIEVGLVTNGILLDRLAHPVTWCRISVSDTTGPDMDAVYRAVKDLPGIDWAFSYVVSSAPNVRKLHEFCRIVEENASFTHIRVVSDLLDLKNVPNLDNFSDTYTKAIFQGRKTPRHGGPCWMHLLKPVISPDLKVYTCCGAQYALDPPSLKMPDELCVGTLQEYSETLDRSAPFDGSICAKCYYTSYNHVLEALLTEHKHEVFL